MRQNVIFCIIFIGILCAIGMVVFAGVKNNTPLFVIGGFGILGLCAVGGLLAFKWDHRD